MSFAMDDLGMSYGIDAALQTKISKEKPTVETTAEVKPSDSNPKEPEVNDVFENVQQDQSKVKNSFKEVQEEYTAADITKEALKKIDSYVKDIKNAVESNDSADVSKQKINDSYEKIVKVAKETSFNDQPLIEASKTDKKTLSLEELKIPDIKKLEINTQEQKDESAKKLEEIAAEIKNKEQEYNKKQEELIQKVNANSLVEIKPASASETETEIEIAKEKEISAQKLKDEAIKNINDAPKKSIKMHVKHIDRNLLLAMISLRSA